MSIVNPGPWRVVIFTAAEPGLGLFRPLIEAKGHRVAGIVGAPGPRSRRTDDYLALGRYARPGLDVIISNYPNRWADMIRPLRPDLIVCIGFNWKIPADVLAVPRLGVVNLHDALLPKYRGRSATGWALRNGDDIGITWHFMLEAFDTGPILAQRRVSITDDDGYFDDVRPRWIPAACEAFNEALDRIAAGDGGTAQDEALATWCSGAFEREWRYLDWSKPARETFLQVRSWYGARGVPVGALAEIEGQKVLISSTRPTGLSSNDAIPGTVLDRRTDGSLLIQCGDGPLEILNWRVQTDEDAVWS